MPKVELVSPFPLRHLDLAWRWLNEFPERNFDDYGPKSEIEFYTEMSRRELTEMTWGVRKDGELCGIIGYLPVTPRFGWFHGICFSRWAWGRETTMVAVKRVIDELFRSGVEKIAAGYYADNSKIARFLRDLGAEDEGLLRKQTLRGGVPVDMKLVALFKG